MKRMVLALLLAFSANAEIAEIKLPVPPELDRADLYVIRPRTKPRAVLVLCPGYNGNGKWMVESEAWQEFAAAHDLALCGLSFASPKEILAQEKGYYHPSRGAGKSLLDGIRKVYGSDLPILIFGFSGGARFTTRFVEANSDRIIAWCAYAAGSWDKVKKVSLDPPGIIACGSDDPLYGASLGHFLQGRAVGRKWTWLSLGNTGHEMSGDLDVFVRKFFAEVLEHERAVPQWRDIDLKTELSEHDANAQPTLACWLPSEAVAQAWAKIHRP